MAPWIPTARHPLHKLLGSRALSAPRHLLASIHHRLILAARRSPLSRGTRGSVTRGMATASGCGRASRPPDCQDTFLAALDCASRMEPVKNAKPGATLDFTSFAHTDIATQVGLKFSGTKLFAFSDVLSLHYRDRVPSCLRILSIPGAASCKKAVSKILLFSVEHSLIEATRAHPPATDV
ncbi:hypothetical protein AURDEDRAFT_168614 [Auricularia subglabra TFB-10046 SS5]|nr:hypothetical protein AURDEDRAFT_168614 [Auricularia subglabra TFB-10046 SS5]